MQVIDATNLDYKAVNEALRETDRDCTLLGCCRLCHARQQDVPAREL